MKNLFFFSIIILIPFCINAQIDYSKMYISFESKYLVRSDDGSWEVSNNKGPGVMIGADEKTVGFSYCYNINEDDVVWSDFKYYDWEYDGREPSGEDVYFMNSLDLVEFDYSRGEIRVYYNWDEKKLKYQNLHEFVDVFTDDIESREYIPQTQRKN